jgi:hypothetical protein
VITNDVTVETSDPDREYELAGNDTVPPIMIPLNDEILSVLSETDRVQEVVFVTLSKLKLEQSEVFKVTRLGN